MRIRMLGWAGVEVQTSESMLVIDPLSDATTTFARLGDAVLPMLVPPSRPGTAAAGLLTHLHRDHADAGALIRALRPGAPVLKPSAYGGDRDENLGIAQADAELARSGLSVREISPWETTAVDGFSLATFPAVDSVGEPQVSWVVHAEGQRLVHCGDTMFHGWWWRAVHRFGPFDLALLPINGAVVSFPHRQPSSPLPAVMTPEQAVIAGRILGARTVVPMHYGGFDLDGVYRPADDAAERFLAGAAGEPFDVRVLEAGEELTIESPAAAG